MRLNWVFFDLGSTLTDESTFEDYFLSKVYESLKKNGIDVNRDAFNKTLKDIIKERRYGSGGYRNITGEVVRSFTRDKKVLNIINLDYNQKIYLWHTLYVYHGYIEREGLAGRQTT